MLTWHFISFLAVISGISLASPIENEPVLVQRQVRDWNCGGQPYTAAHVQAAFTDTINRAVHQNFAYKGKTPYPHEFRNGKPTQLEVNPDPCAGLSLQEFPILKTGAHYTGGNPGPDRVVIGSSNPAGGVWQECFLMTHTGAKGNLFLKCT
ncbi:Ribonuclease/ribotoxin [Annulohypoxylon nitens]|nr:Ribonuclease/ribotoxin [Annulohypoxylon nitens]